MKTPEEYAEELVQVTPYEPDDGTYWLRFSGHRGSPPATGEANLYSNRDDAEYDAAIHRRTIAGVIRLAIEDAHATWMASAPGGISEDKLNAVARAVAADQKVFDRLFTQTIRVGSSDDLLLRYHEHCRELLAHIQHQAALIEDIAQLSSEYTEARERIRKEARREGWRECKIACLENAKAFCQQAADDEGTLCDDVERLLDSINDVPDSPP